MTLQEFQSAGGKASAAKLTKAERKARAKHARKVGLLNQQAKKGALRRQNQRTNTGGSKRRAKAAKQ